MSDILDNAPVRCSSCHGAKRLEVCVRHSSDHACDEGRGCSRRLVTCDRCNGAGAVLAEQSERWRCDNLPPSEWGPYDGEALLEALYADGFHIWGTLDTIAAHQWFAAGDPTNRLPAVLAALDAAGTEAAQRAAAALRRTA